MADYGTFQYAGSTFPLSADPGAPLLLDADPALYYAIDYFSSVLTTHMGQRLLAQASAGPGAVTLSQPVTQVAPYNPDPYLTENQVAFPFLAVYRNKSDYEDVTVTWPHEVSEWTVQYILPPLNAGQMERIGPILSVVPKILQNRIENGFDPGYQNGARVWAIANIEAIRLMSGVFSRYEAGGNLVFPCWTGKLVVKERVMPLAGAFQTLRGIDFSADAASPNDPQITGFVAGSTEFTDPTTISGLALWLRGDAGITNALDGFHVSAWADGSSAANNAIQNTGNNQPVDVLAAITDATGTQKAVVRFDGSASYLQATVTPLAQDTGKTLVVLARVSNQTARQTIACQTLAADTGAKTFGVEANTASGVGGRFGIIAGGSTFDSAIGVDTQWHTFTLRTSNTTNGQSIASTTSLRIDGVTSPLALKSGSGTWGGMATSNLVALGGIPAAMSSTAFAGDIAVVFALSTSVSDADAARLETLCRQFAGL